MGSTIIKKKEKEKTNNHVPKAEVFTQLFANIDSSHVANIPWDVNGNKHFVIKNCEGKWTKKVKDGWWFCLHSSSRKGFVGYRRISKCYGSYK